MKILVFSNPFSVVGGCQVNAIELNAELRDVYGHDVVLFAAPGPMVKVAMERGLRFIPAPEIRNFPTLTMARALSNVIRHERPDLIQAWQYPQTVDAFYAGHLFLGIPMLAIDMHSECVARFSPKSPITTYGTPEFVDRARAIGRNHAELLLPPVDVRLNAPGAVDPRQIREQCGIGPNDILLVTVSRLSANLKYESLRRTIHAVRELGRELPVRLVLVGDGDARSRVEGLADDANAALGRRAVSLTGELLDPRPAYAAADIVIGMGGSALRGAAFGKPVIIVGERGFSAPLNQRTAQSFYYHGIYGIGDGSASNARLTSDILSLIQEKDNLLSLGAFSRQFVTTHFSLEAVSARLEAYCQAAVSRSRQRPLAVADGLRTFAILKLGRFTPSIVRKLAEKVQASRTRHLRDSKWLSSAP
jgi:glycosyltransferase involved in cell wall biosynthesis